MAFLARYGHQQIPQVIGRRLTAREVDLLIACIEDYVVTERKADPLGLTASPDG